MIRSFRSQAGITLADVALALGVTLLLVAVIVPAFFFSTLDQNQKDIREALKHLSTLQRTYFASRVTSEFAPGLGVLKSINTEPKFEGMFDYQHFGYQLDMDAVTARKAPRFLLDNNLILTRLADINGAFYLRDQPAYTYRDAFTYLTARRMQMLEADQNFSWPEPEALPVDLNAALADANATVTPLMLAGYPWARLKVVLDEIIADYTPSADGNGTLVARVPTEDVPDANVVVLTIEEQFIADLNALLVDASPLRAHLDMNLSFVGKTTWSAAASPLSYGYSGRMSYYIDDTGLIRGHDIEGEMGHAGLKKLEE